MRKFDKDFILYELSDDELKEFMESDDDVYNYNKFLEKNGVDEKMTVKGLLKREGLKYDDLSDFAQNYFVGVCNSVNRTENQIYVYRDNSDIRTNIKIRVNKNSDVPYLTHQIQIGDNFIHEEGYTDSGFCLYSS